MFKTKTKLYTSRYSNKNLSTSKAVKVGITRGTPRFKIPYTLDGDLKLLAPPSYIFRESNKTIFKRRYFEYLNSLGVEKVRQALEVFHYGEVDEMILLCYEDITCDDPAKNWCHRSYFAEWWHNKTGQIVEEYKDDNNFESKNKIKQQVKEIEIYKQELLF